MHMTFWWSSTINDFLIPGCNIKSVGALVATCFIFAAFAVLFEWFKLIQAIHRQKQLLERARQIRTICAQTESASLLTNDRTAAVQSVKTTLCTQVSACLWDGFLWFNLQILSYLLMLIVMLYNGWLTVSLILGSGIGYFIFGTRFMKINLQNLIAMREAFCSLPCSEGEKDGETTPALVASTSAVSVSEIENQTSVFVHSPSGES